MSDLVKKIVVIGPESTGKSSLCQQLSDYYKTSWVKEYAREYLWKNGKDYTIVDLDDIAKGQIEHEDLIVDQLSPDKKMIFIDTDMYVMKVWSEFVFNACNHLILNQIVSRQYDLYLLCTPDIAWVSDELREYPDVHTREKLFHYYKDAMIHQHTPWVTIHGNYEERLQQAIDAVDSLFD